MKIASPFNSQQCALITAIAVCERFPGAQIVRALAQENTYFVDIVLDTEWDSSFLPLIEQNCEQLCASELHFEILEMVPRAASGLFAQKRQELLSLTLPQHKAALVEILRLEDWALPLKTEHEFTSLELFLDEARSVGRFEDRPIYRFRGALGKKRAVFSSYPFDEWKEEENGWSYLPEGEKIRRQMEDFWKNILIEKDFEIVSTPQGGSWEEAGKQLAGLGQKRVAQLSYLLHPASPFTYGIFTPLSGFQDQFYYAASETEVLEVVISSLQMMQQISKIFSFASQVVLLMSQGSHDEKILRTALERQGLRFESEPAGSCAIEFRFCDADGLPWPGPRLEIARTKGVKKETAISGTLFGPWERFLALALQKEQGVPFVLAEEQVRIFLLRHELKAYAENAAAALRQKGLRVQLDDGCEEKLGERMHRAHKKKVPYFVVIGPKEAAEQKIAWKDNKTELEMTTTLDEFVQKVKV